MFFEQFKKRCAQQKTSPTAVAVTLGIARGNVTNWKNGKVPNGDTLALLAKELDCSVDFLLGKTDDPTPADKKNTPLEQLGSKEALRQALIKKGIIPADRDLTEEESETLLSIAASYIKNKGKE